MLVSLSLWPFMRIGGMSQEHYRALIAGAVAELRDPRMKLYYKVWVFCDYVVPVADGTQALCLRPTTSSTMTPSFAATRISNTHCSVSVEHLRLSEKDLRICVRQVDLFRLMYTALLVYHIEGMGRMSLMLDCRRLILGR